MKKELKVVAIVLVALIVFLSGFGIGATKGGIKIAVNVSGDAQPANGGTVTPTNPPVADTQPTTPPTTQAPVASDPATTAADASTPNGGASEPATTAAGAGTSTSAGTPSSKEDIVAKYNELINGMKSNPGTVKLHKTSNTVINVTDAPAMKDQINKIVQGLVKPSDTMYTFTGNGSMGTEDTNNNAECDMKNIITPGGRDVALKAEGVKDATCTPSGDGYTMTINLIEETSSFNGTDTVNPVHHESCLSPLNLATLDISPAKISEANMTYPGATLILNVDGQGRLAKYETKLPMSGSGSGKLVVSLSVGLEGSMDEVYEFTY
ncbi:MAG: hypothetical protein NC110_00815 [Ruminococcus sp.]|nr:hypothetical protein [Ruminococcus sp.]